MLAGQGLVSASIFAQFRRMVFCILICSHAKRPVRPVRISCCSSTPVEPDATAFG